MRTEERRQALLTGARLTAAAALGALAATLGLRRRPKATEDPGYCDRAGRCRECGVTASCDAYQATHLGGRP